jgi:hypothetical protein
MTKKENIAVLTIHRDQLAGCNTFEAFKAQQIAFVDFLIETFTAEDAKEERVQEILTQEGLA